MPRCKYVSHPEEATGRIPKRGPTPVRHPCSPCNPCNPCRKHCITAGLRTMYNVLYTQPLGLSHSRHCNCCCDFACIFDHFSSTFIFPSSPRFCFSPRRQFFILLVFPFILPCYGVAGPDAKQKRGKKVPATLGIRPVPPGPKTRFRQQRRLTRTTERGPIPKQGLI